MEGGRLDATVLQEIFDAPSPPLPRSTGSESLSVLLLLLVVVVVGQVVILTRQSHYYLSAETSQVYVQIKPAKKQKQMYPVTRQFTKAINRDTGVG